ncbi:hypothetical protein BGZ76_010878 [Entomortierella beljakovae]|nr:hypothetical protein BGZ76_010878 [Entomortierella beljakovae]
MISAAIAQAASAYQQSLNSQVSDDEGEDDETAAKTLAENNGDLYIFEDDIVSLKSQVSAKIPLSSKNLLRTPKPFDGVQSLHRGPAKTDPIVRVVFVSGPSGVGKTSLIQGMAAVARNSGLFAGGVFEADGAVPYSAILSCVQSVIQQLLAQHTDALASLVIAIRTAFEPHSGIGIICDLIPELRYFFSGSEMPESKDIPLTHSVARFHALILKLIRVISTHFFMTWLIDDLQFADENSIELLATLVNVNKRLPIVLIITHRDTPDCLMKVKHILGGGNIVGGQNLGGTGALGAVHHDKLMGDLSAKAGGSSRLMSKSSALRGTGTPLVVRGGGGVRFIRLQNPNINTIKEFLSALLHRDKDEVTPLASVFQQKTWMTIRQLALELYRNRTIHFDCMVREWKWEACQETLAETVRKLTGEEFEFLRSRFRALDCNTKRALVCASICGPSFKIHDLQKLVTGTYGWSVSRYKHHADAKPTTEHPAEENMCTESQPNINNGCSAMAGIQYAIREGILVYTSVTDHLRFHHGIMRKVAMNLLEDSEDLEKLHFSMTNILFSTPEQEFRIASHVLQCVKLIKKKIALGVRTSDDLHNALLDSETSNKDEQWSWSEADIRKAVELDTRSLRRILSLAGEKSQKSGAQDMALTYWDAALSLLPETCWDRPPKVVEMNSVSSQERDVVKCVATSFPQSPELSEPDNSRGLLSRQVHLYHEALKLHLQCIEAERWAENFDKAMSICEIVLAKVKDPIDRARVYQHQIEMYVWAYSAPEKAIDTTIRGLRELGMSKEVNFNPSEEQIKVMFEDTHAMLLRHMPELEAKPPKTCTDQKIAMMMEVLSVASASLYYCNIPFIATGIVQSMKLTCEHGITKDTGRSLVSFALTYSTWYERLDHVYELGRLACDVSNGNHHVKFLFYLAVQQWGEHVAESIPALEETLTAVDLTCDRLFHTAGMIHVSVMKVLLGRIQLSDLMTTTIDMLTKHIEFGPKSHGVEAMQGILQMIKCFMGRTLSSNPETIFEDIDFSDMKNLGKAQSSKKPLTLVHNSSTCQMLQVLAAFVFGHYGFIQEVTDPWHDDSRSIMNFEGSWITHAVFTVVGLSLVSLLRTETDPVLRRKYKSRVFRIREKMKLRANKYPTNHAAMYYLLEAEIADQGLVLDDEDDDMGDTGNTTDLSKVLLLYENAIQYSSEGDFPLHKCFAYEYAGRSYLRNGLRTGARCLMANACKMYKNWGAKGKVQLFHTTYPEFFPSPPETDASATKRGIFYKPSENNTFSTNRPMAPSVTTSTGNTTLPGPGSSASVGTNSPWMASSPKALYSPTIFGADAVSAAAAAMASSSFQSGCPSASSTSSSTLSAPPYSLQNTWLGSPQTPEIENVDLDVLDFSSVIEAMQVIASDIDLDLLLVKSLGVLNQSVGAKRCCVIISKDHELVLSASLGDSGRCESVKPPLEISKCNSVFHGIINYVIHTSAPCLVTNAKDDPRFCADEYLKQRGDLMSVLCAPILHKSALVGVLYMEDFPERAFANKRMLVMNLLVQQLGISITNALLYQSVLQSETKLNGLLENMPCGIALWDALAESCQYISSAWTDMTGYSAEEIMTAGWGILMHPDELVTQGLGWKDRVRAGLPCQWECRYGAKDGTYRWGIVRMLPIMSSTDDNKILQWLTVTVDIDDQRRAVMLKSNFLANMSHELRTPFSGILGMLSLLRDSSGLTHEQFEFVDMAKASCEMLIRIVDDLLNFSKLEADKVTLEDIPLCFEEIVGVPLASKKGLELVILVDVTLPVLLIGDPDRMKQILMNLIGNAIKFSTSGSVVIKYWHEVRKRNDIKSLKAKQSVIDTFSGKCKLEQLRTKMEKDLADESQLGDEVTLHCSVTDQGIGMTPEEQKLLFVSFQQTDSGTTRKYGGTGLGLSICAQLINHMNGKVVVESEKDKGSTFTFSAKVRTMTEREHEQNLVESTRILSCEKALVERWDILKQKRFLILSPNKLLREQIMITIGTSECMEFDGVASAVQAGALGILGNSTKYCAAVVHDTIAAMTPNMENAQKSVNSNAHLVDANSGECSCGKGSSSPRSHLEETIRQFDFILVDHVLDSAELDCIYPAPLIAFVLLLAPTTETLRWILPPAQRRIDTWESEELDSDQVDIGGRGRIQKVSDADFPEKAIGQVRSSSFMSKVRPDTIMNILGDQQQQATAAKTLKKIPSELFKRKRFSIKSISKKKRRNPDGKVTNLEYTSHGCANLRKEEASKTTLAATATHDSQPRTSFQICRMIKPVRRLKLLQILYNAVVQHEQKLRGECGDDDTDQLTINEISDQDETIDDDEEGERGDDEMLNSVLPSDTPSNIDPDSAPTANTSLKRRFSKGPLDGASNNLINDDDGHSSSSSSGNSSVAGGRLKSRPPLNKIRKHHSSSSPSSTILKSGSESSQSQSDMPKRGRNNDALTLLLSQEERSRCKGVNVLVAEDDFVSQKILEKQLSKLGMNVIIANNGQEAVDQWLAVEQGYYTIAIFDHHMPIMDGLAATKKIRALEEERDRKSDSPDLEISDGDGSDSSSTDSKSSRGRIPIVGLSADIQLSTKEKCIKAGMDEYMTKPLLTQGLALLIQRKKERRTEN